jgi:protein SCO1/2
MRLLTALTILVVVTACRPDDTRTYQLTGQILVVNAAAREVLVKHDDIPGFMPAMTMPYTVSDPAILKDRVPGDVFVATLKVAPDGAYLTDLKKTGSAPLPDDARTTIPAAANVHVLQPGDTVPDTTLTDQDGRAIALTDFKGSALAVTFIYTRCPLPQYCPLMDRRFAEVQKLAAANPALAGKIRLLSVSFDPAFDRPETLAAHAKKLGADPKVWRFATADEAIVDRLAAAFRINVIREKDGTITHNLRTAVIDPTGHVQFILGDNDWTAENLVAALTDAITYAR